MPEWMKLIRKSWVGALLLVVYIAGSFVAFETQGACQWDCPAGAPAWSILTYPVILPAMLLAWVLMVPFWLIGLDHFSGYVWILTAVLLSIGGLFMGAWAQQTLRKVTKS